MSVAYWAVHKPPEQKCMLELDTVFQKLPRWAEFAQSAGKAMDELDVAHLDI